MIAFQYLEIVCTLAKMSAGGRYDMIISKSSAVSSVSRNALPTILRVIRFLGFCSWLTAPFLYPGELVAWKVRDKVFG
jgi:hypothetical protein